MTGATTSDDPEREFYRVLAGGLSGDTAAQGDDLLDMRQGSHSRRTASGKIGMLLALDEDQAKMFWRLVRHVLTHDCDNAKERLMYLLVRMAMDLEKTLGDEVVQSIINEEEEDHL